MFEWLGDVSRVIVDSFQLGENDSTLGGDNAEDRDDNADSDDGAASPAKVNEISYESYNKTF